MSTSTELVALVENWAVARGLPSGTGAALLASCPWLNGEDAMSEELAPQLLEEAFLPYGLGEEEAESLCAAYNEYVDGDYRATAPAREAAYAAMQGVLVQHGEIGLSGEFWLMEDSLSTCRPWIFVRDPASLSQALISSVSKAAALCTEFNTVVFSDEAGENLIEVAVSKNDA